MSRKHSWDFKNRHQQHKALVEVEKCYKQYWRNAYHETKHTKKGWRKVDYLRGREWIKKARANGWIK